MADDGKIDPTSPYYLGSGDQPGNLITHVILKGDNYLAWARPITVSLKARRKFGFVDGTIPKPTDPKKLLDWETVNSMIVSWLLRSMDPKVVESIPFHDEAKKLWDYLEKRFCVANGPRIQQLRADIIGCKQTKSMSIENYYNRLIGLYDELNRLKPVHTCECKKCTCNVVGKFIKDREDEKFHQFLIGVDDDLYAVVRSNLLSQQPIPDLDRAYQTFLQEERSRGIALGRVEKEEANVFALQADRLNGRRDKSKLYCHNCKKSGHDNGTCFKIHGFPEWWNDRSRGKGSSNLERGKAITDRSKVSMVRANAVSGSNSTTTEHIAATDVGSVGGGASMADFTPDQLQILLNLVNNRQHEQMSGPTFGDPDWSW